MRLPVPLCRIAYRGAYTALRAYWFARRPEVKGVKCVITDGTQLLLVRHTYGHREWDLPGGKLRRGEDPARAAAREMDEELGITTAQWSALGRVRVDIDYRRDHIDCFHANVGPVPLSVDRCELAAVRWFPREQLPGEVGEIVPHVLALLDGHKVDAR